MAYSSATMPTDHRYWHTVCTQCRPRLLRSSVVGRNIITRWGHAAGRTCKHTFSVYNTLMFWWNISNNTTLIFNYFTSQGDTIHLTCTSNMSQPAAKLEWTVNNQPVKVGHLQTCEPCLTMLGMEITILLAERAQSAQSAGWPVCHDMKQGAVNQVLWGVFLMF